MSAVGRRLTIVAVAASAALLLFAAPALAKALPVDSVVVETPRPEAGQPVAVVVRFGDNFDLGDYAWENAEVSALPTARTNPQGWPLDRNDRGVPIKLHRVGKGMYRGSFVVVSPGDYVLVDWSSVYAKDDRAAGVVVTRTYPTPIKVHVRASSAQVRATGSAAAPKARASRLKDPLVRSVIAVGGFGVVASALLLLRRRYRANTPGAPGDADSDANADDRVQVSSGARSV
jgi:hypothetical protein